MTTKISNEAADLVITSYNTALAGGSIKIYTGAQPATVNTAASGTLLGTITLGSPVFDSTTNGVGTLNAPIETAAIAAGTAGYARISKSDGTAFVDGDITESGGGGVFIIDTATVAIDDVLRVLSYTLTMPKE